MTTATLPTRTAARKIAAPRRRTVRLPLAPTAAATGHLILTETKGETTTRTNFLIERLACESGAAFRLTKFAEDRRGDGDDIYDVQMAGKGECGCRGCGRWGHCRHLEALAALVAAKKL